jgi:hypothetical protein
MNDDVIGRTDRVHVSGRVDKTYLVETKLLAKKTGGLLPQSAKDYHALRRIQLLYNTDQVRLGVANLPTDTSKKMSYGVDYRSHGRM